MRTYLYTVNCSDLNTLNNIYTSTNDIFDLNGNLCFNYSYTLTVGQTFSECADFLVVGFQPNNSSERVYISYTIKIT